MRASSVAIAVVCLCLLGGCSINPVTGQKELILIPESQEIAMGVSAAPELEKEFGGKVADAQVQSYVQGLGAKLATISDRPEMPWEFALVSSKVPNAFALPGGKVFVTAGLFRSLTNERQLAAVLGHEIGHVCAKHNVKGMQRQMGASVLAELAGKVGGEQAEAAKAAASVAASMVVLKYSRDDEYQADSLGIKYMAKAGYNPYGMVETLEFLQTLGSKDESKFGEMFQTHPLSSERVKEAKATVSSGYPQASPGQGDPRVATFMAMRNRLGPN
jgi:predicted Zn-dependent protease